MKILIQIISLILILTLNIFQTSNLQAQCHIDDWTALKALYESTDGDNWRDNTGWGEVAGTVPPAGCDLGMMYGVTLDGNGRVSELNLSSNRLTGSIPSELGDLSNLGGLFLQVNQLNGNIPSELGNLGNLTALYLYVNHLIGSIPSEIGNLGNLTFLSLYSNHLTGSIPTEIGSLSNLTLLSLSLNQLSGSIPIEIGDLNNLTDLSLHSNQLSGSIPVEIGNLSNLINLSLQSNQLSGSIPVEIGNLSNLDILSLYSNQLSGSIPVEIGNLSNLTRLYSSSNQLSGNIPIEISNLSNLITLSLNSNQLIGSIPVEIGDLSNLTVLSLYSNQLTGIIPRELGDLTNLRYLYLHSNQLNGVVPRELGNLSNLEQLYLYSNQIGGCYDSNLINLCTQLAPTYNTNTYISNGNNFDVPWEDFCNTEAGTCDDRVFPGDCNNDGIVNTEDALYWGLAEGFNGAVRSNATTDCALQVCSDWSQYIDGINSKHQDGDGNGTIDGQDLQIIRNNFGCINNYTAPAYVSGTSVYRLPSQGINNNDEYQYDLYAENSSGVAATAHGLSFTISSDVIPISAITMSTMGSSLNPDEIIKVFDGNKCHVALTRTNNADVTCVGPIATFTVATTDVPVGIPFEIDVTYGSKIKADATLDNITGASAFGIYNGIGPNSDNLTLDVSVTHEQCNGLGEAIAIPSGGTTPLTYAWSTGSSSPQVTNLASGSYTVTVSDANGLSQSLTFQINGQTPIYDANGNLLCGNLCPDFLAPSGVTGTGSYSAYNTLDSDATVPTGNTTQYKAGQIVKLDQGFEVQPNSEFSAEIDDCQ